MCVLMPSGKLSGVFLLIAGTCLVTSVSVINVGPVIFLEQTVLFMAVLSGQFFIKGLKSTLNKPIASTQKVRTNRTCRILQRNTITTYRKCR